MTAESSRHRYISGWYATTADPDDIQQGDFFSNLNVWVQESPSQPPGGEPLADVGLDRIPLAVVISQSCDLEGSQADMNVLLCPVWTVLQLAEEHSKSFVKRIWDPARKGTAFNYFALPASDISGHERPESLVDFGQTFELRLIALRRIASGMSERCRIASPYREQLAQHFAKRIMRVATDAQLPEWDEINKSVLPEGGEPTSLQPPLS